MDSEIDIRPSLGEILNSYERYTYKPETAIAEFVDNSTASYFQNKPIIKALNKDYQLDIRINYNPAQRTLIIEDNAFGMDLETFKNALTIAKRPKNTAGRNEFGMGLKTAASWFGKRWRVATTTYNNSKMYEAEVDVNELIETRDNTIKMNDEECDINKHGTKVILMELTRRITPTAIEKLIKDLKSIYRRDISSGEIKISINEIVLEYEQPKILFEKVDGIDKEWKENFGTTINFEGQDYYMKGFFALRETGNYRETGFTLFRRNRVIIGGLDKGFKPEKIFGATNSFMSLRLFGEVDLDNWPVTQAKDDFDWDINGLRDLFTDELYKLSEHYIKKSKEYRVTEKSKESKITSLDAKSFGDDTITDILKINPEIIKVDNGQVEIITDTFEGYKDITSYRVKIKVLNTEYLVQVHFINNPEDELLKVNDIDGNLIITINSAFPFFEEMDYNKKFINLLQKYLVILVLSEKYATQISTSGDLIKSYSIREIMNQILMEICTKKGDYEEYDMWW